MIKDLKCSSKKRGSLILALMFLGFTQTVTAAISSTTETQSVSDGAVIENSSVEAPREVPMPDPLQAADVYTLITGATLSDPVEMAIIDYAHTPSAGQNSGNSSLRQGQLDDSDEAAARFFESVKDLSGKETNDAGKNSGSNTFIDSYLDLYLS